MNENNNENGNSEIPEVEELVLDEGDDTETVKTKVEEYKTKVDARNAQLFARAKKAEGFSLVDGKWMKQKPETKETKIETKASTKDEISQTDLYALIKANVPEEDIDEVIEYAKLKNIAVADALKTNVVKTILSQKAEERTTADATNTSGARRGNAKLSDEALLSKAEKGELPEDEDEIKRLIKLQRARR